VGSEAILIAELQGVVGRRNVLIAAAATLPYRTGYRIGEGEVLAVVKPSSLVELWRVAEVCVAADTIIIVQAANTGLTGGSTPNGVYDRPVVLISTLKIDKVIPIHSGDQSICLAGATLTTLEARLSKFSRTPHSVIGSSCIGASVVGGICNNSGGALVERGPAFTRHSLFARVDERGRLVLVNNLGIALGDDPIAILSALDRGLIEEVQNQGQNAPTGLSDYEAYVRDIDAPTPARYNADSRCHFEAAGSAGKVLVFAVRVDSFPAPAETVTFLLSSDRQEDLGQFRRDALSSFDNLPISAEYLHRDTARIGASHGNDMCLAVRHLGAHRMPTLFAAKRSVDRMLRRFRFLGRSPSDRILQILGRLAPHPLPSTVRQLAELKEHMLLVTMADEGIEEARAHLRSRQSPTLVSLECDAAEAAALQRVRFAAAGAMVRYSDFERGVGALVAIDCALPRNSDDWRVRLSARLADQVLVSAIYGHFFCHVFHFDFVLKPGANPETFEAELIAEMMEKGIECPAEHNFGHHYQAPNNVVEFYRALDPTNTFNPGVGLTSRLKHWQ
jgi:D-lactate dehydrogenase